MLFVVNVVSFCSYFNKVVCLRLTAVLLGGGGGRSGNSLISKNLAHYSLEEVLFKADLQIFVFCMTEIQRQTQLTPPTTSRVVRK